MSKDKFTAVQVSIEQNKQAIAEADRENADFLRECERRAGASRRVMLSDIQNAEKDTLPDAAHDCVLSLYRILTGAE